MKKRHTSLTVGAFAVIVLAISLLAACSLPLPTIDPLAQGDTPSAQPSAEPAPAGPTASFDGITFALDPDVAIAANGLAVPDTSDPSTPPEYDKGPARVTFSFDGYTGPTATIPAFVYVYNVADLAGLPEEAMASGLAAMLQERPDLAGQQQLPFLPTMNAAQGMHAREAYRDFGSGSGIESIVLYAQDASPITAERLWYTFQGLTSDGQHYVAAVFPLSTDLFPKEIAPDFDYDAWFAGYDQYMADSRQALADAPANRFAPSLDKLEALVQSITVAPQVAAAAEEAPEAQPAVAGLAGTYATTLPAADTPGRAITVELKPDGTASMSTNYMNGEPIVVETGTWKENGDGTATVTFTHVENNELATPDVLTFTQQPDGSLAATAYDLEAYGTEGLTLQKSGDIAQVPATPAEPAASPESDAAGPPAEPVGITGVTWQLQEIRRDSGLVAPVADPSKYTLTFNGDGTVAIVADCNTGTATYQVNGDAITFEQLATTLMACPQPSMGSQFTKVLEFADSYAIENGLLLLSYSNGAGTLTFAPAGQ